MIEEINYRTYPKLFSNRCLVSVSLFERIADLLEEGDILDATDLLTLQSLAEAITFQENIILENEEVVGGAQIVEGNGSSALVELIRKLDKGKIFDPEPEYLPKTGTSASNTLQFEASILSTPGAEPIKADFVHGSHIIIERFSRHSSTISISQFTSENLHSRIAQTWTSNYVEALKRFGYDREIFPGFVPQPWKLLADCHGIPYINNPFYSLRDVNSNLPTNIGIDLYRKLEDLHKDYFTKIQKYLGPTYVYVPPILNLVLENSNKPEDIPNSLLAVRERFKKFRNACTLLEIELRQAKTLSSQIEIIREIEAAYVALTERIEKPKTRILLRLFDILKELDPIHMSVEALDQIKNYVVEEEGLIKMPGYFDLWKASIDVKQSSINVRRVFGNQVSPNIFREFEQLKKIVDSEGAKTSRFI